MKGPDRIVNPLRFPAPRLIAAFALAIVATASLFASPSAVLAQRVQDLPTAASHGSVPAPLAPGASGKVKAPLSTVTLSPQILQQLEEQAAAAQVPKSPLATKAPWLTHTFAAIFLIAAVGLVLLLAFQTTKQEGLSGTIGGRVEAAYRPRLGFDQQLQRVTTFAAITFVVFATIVSLTGI